MAENSTSYWEMIKQTAADWSDDKSSTQAGALAYYTAISLAPLIILSIAILSWVVGDQAAQGQVAGQVEGLVGAQAAGAIEDIIASASEQGSGILATVVSLVILLVGASGVFAQLQDAMNTIWEVKPKPDRGWWGMIRSRFLSMGMVLGVAFILLVSLFVSTALTTASHAIFPNYQWLGYLIDLVASLVVITLLFAVIFKYLPDVKIQWRDVWLGAAVTAVLFIVGKYLLSLYLGFSSTASAYGAAGSFVALLIWVYYSSMIFFFGAEFTQVYARSKGHPIVPDENAIPVTSEERAVQGREPRKRSVASEDKPGLHAGAPAAGREKRVVVEREVPVLRDKPEPTVGPTAAGGAGLATGLLLGAVGLILYRQRAERAVEAQRLLHDVRDRLHHAEDRVLNLSRNLDDADHKYSVLGPRKKTLARTRKAASKTLSRWLDHAPWK